MYSILNEDPTPLSGVRTGVPLDLEHLIDKALSKDAGERYQHADELVADLKHQRRALESGVAGEPSATAPIRTKRRT